MSIVIDGKRLTGDAAEKYLLDKVVDLSEKVCGANIEITTLRADLAAAREEAQRYADQLAEASIDADRTHDALVASLVAAGRARDEALAALREVVRASEGVRLPMDTGKDTPDEELWGALLNARRVLRAAPRGQGEGAP